MGPEPLGVLLFLGLILAGTQQWVSLPLGIFLSIVWLSALGWLSPTVVPLTAVVGLAQCALWIELASLLRGTRARPREGLLEPSASGFLGGVLGGFALWYGVDLPGAPLTLGFLGALFACMVQGGGFDASLTATVLLPVREDRAAQSVPLFFLLSVALGAVPR